MKKILMVFGTRPEAIKMGPIYHVLKNDPRFETYVCVTGQHRHMLDQVLTIFNIQADFDLDIMQAKQDLFDVTTRVLERVKDVLKTLNPDIVLVHGDTSTAFATALACFYLNIPIGHVEAGLRTYQMDSPFPEEFNRQAISLVARYHFAPTDTARMHLLAEGKEADHIFVTGNTAIDALAYTIKKDYHHPILDWVGNHRLVLLTAHRRENLGQNLESILKGIVRVLEEHQDIRVVFPVHLNPVIREVAETVFKDQAHVRLIEPLDVMDFHNILSRSFLVLTDSGGIQEEAPGLDKPVLVLRNTTERPEGVEAGTLLLVGTEEENVYRAFKQLVENEEIYNAMSLSKNPYGDGHASEQIRDILSKAEL